MLLLVNTCPCWTLIFEPGVARCNIQMDTKENYLYIITLFISIIMLCGTKNIPCKFITFNMNMRIFVEYSHLHITLLWI